MGAIEAGQRWVRDRESRAGYFVAAALFWTSACATGNPSPSLAPAPDTVVVVDTVLVGGPNPELEERLARLQLQVMEKDAQLVALQDKFDAAIKEVVRSMAMLQTVATRAEAASGMAEAEIALEALRAAAGAVGALELAQAQRLLEMSGAEFNDENYGGSLYLASQARSVARTGEGRFRGGSAQSLRPGEVLFAVPLQLVTVSRSNVREGPGTQFGVVFTVEANAPLVGHSYTDQWVRVSTDDDRTGWIFHSLVGGR